MLAEIKAVKAACKGKLLKVIIETCFLTDAEKIKLCEIVTASGAEFIKTSTGFGGGGATREDVALFKACLLYTSGQPINKQIDILKKKPQIVVATPGRLADHMKRRTVRVDTAQTVVLDEADRMLDMGFIHDVTRLLDRMNQRKNLGMFSATISR